MTACDGRSGDRPRESGARPLELLRAFGLGLLFQLGHLLPPPRCALLLDGDGSPDGVELLRGRVEAPLALLSRARARALDLLFQVDRLLQSPLDLLELLCALGGRVARARALDLLLQVDRLLQSPPDLLDSFVLLVAASRAIAR